MGSGPPAGCRARLNVLPRRATSEDAAAIATVLSEARAKQAFFPPLHTPQDDFHFVRDRMLPTHDVWVVAEEGVVVGFAALTGDVLGHLYVMPRAQRRGIGRVLLDKAKQLRPGGFTLWTHQPNIQARAFYEREGLVVVELTDGSSTEEKVPDVHYAWRPSDRI